MHDYSVGVPGIKGFLPKPLPPCALNTTVTPISEPVFTQIPSILQQLQLLIQFWTVWFPFLDPFLKQRVHKQFQVLIELIMR